MPTDLPEGTHDPVTLLKLLHTDLAALETRVGDIEFGRDADKTSPTYKKYFADFEARLAALEQLLEPNKSAAEQAKELHEALVKRLTIVEAALPTPQQVADSKDALNLISLRLSNLEDAVQLPGVLVLTPAAQKAAAEKAAAEQAKKAENAKQQIKEEVMAKEAAKAAPVPGKPDQPPVVKSK